MTILTVPMMHYTLPSIADVIKLSHMKRLDRTQKKFCILDIDESDVLEYRSAGIPDT